MATYKVYGYDATNIVPVIPSSSDDLSIPGNAIVTGNLTVKGTTTTVDSEIATADNFVHLNAKYMSDAVKNGGFVFTVDPENNELNGNLNIASSTTILIASDVTANFAANDIIQITDSEDAANDGLYQIHSAAFSSPNTTITIKDASTNVPSATVSNFVKNSLTTNSDDDSMKIRVVKVGVLDTDSANGKFRVAFGSASTMTYANVLTSADTITASAVAADDISVGDAAVTIATTTGNIVVDAQGNDTDIIFKGTDNSVDTTFLTLDGSAAGLATFNSSLKIADDGYIGNASVPSLLQLGSTGVATFSGDIHLSTDAKSLFLGSDADTEIKHSDGNGILITGGESKIGFEQSDFAEAIFSSTDGQLDLVAGAEVQIVSPILDLNCSTRVDVSGTLQVGGELDARGHVSLQPNKGLGYHFTSDAAIAVGEVLYFKSNGKVALADADALSTAPVIAIALEAASGADESILCNTMYGAIIDIKLVTTETFARGVAIYLDETAGKATATAPSASGDVVLRLGYAYEAGNGSLSEVQVIFAPEFITQHG
tara:strand:- start:874 stop:2505 length:1632 start_codon:yes stop_codon:yes gene_type:complete